MGIVAQSLQIEVGLSGDDKARQGFAAVVNDFKAGSKGVTAAVQGTSSAAREFKQSNDRVAASLGLGAAKARETKGDFNALGGAARGLRSDLDGVAASGSRTADVFKGALGAGLVSSTINALASGVRNTIGAFFDANIQYEQSSVAFEVMLGSAEKAKDLLAEVSQFAAETPFQLPELNAATKALLAFGSSNRTVVTELRRIGDVSSGVGSAIGEIANIYGKARVQGTLFAEDINQLTGRGIPVIQEFAKQLGVSESQVKKLAAEGKITFTNLEQAFVSMTSAGGRFDGMMRKQSGTLGGLVSTLKDGLVQVLRDIGEGGLMDQLRKTAESTAKWFSENSTRVKEFAQTLGAGLAKALEFTVDNLGAILTAARDLAAFWVGSKIALGISTVTTSLLAFVPAAEAGAVASRGFVASLGPIVAAAAAAQIVIDLLIARQEKLAEKKVSTAWRDDVTQLTQVRDAMRSYAATLSDVQNGPKAQFDPFEAAKKQHDANDVLRSITGYDYQDLSEIQQFTIKLANTKLQALNASKRNVATEDILGFDSNSSAPTTKSVPLSEDQTKNLQKLREETQKIRDEMSRDGEEAIDRELRIEKTRFETALKNAKLSSKEIEAEKQKHLAMLDSINSNHQKEIDSNAEKANKARRDQNQFLVETDEAKTQRIIDSETRMAQIREELMGDSFSRQQAQADAHYREMFKFINLNAKNDAEKQELITALHEKHDAARTQSALASANAQVQSAGELGTTLLRAWDTLYSGAKKNALLHKALAMGMIAIDTARAIMATVKDTGFWGIPLGIAVGALGAAQMAKVSQQKFAEGGIVQGSYTSGDRIPVRANAGEMFLTKAQQANLFAMANGQGSRGGNNSWDINYAPVYNFNGGGGGGGGSFDVMRILRAQPAAFGEFFMRDIIGRGYARMAA